MNENKESNITENLSEIFKDEKLTKIIIEKLYNKLLDIFFEKYNKLSTKYSNTIEIYKQVCNKLVDNYALINKEKFEHITKELNDIELTKYMQQLKENIDLKNIENSNIGNIDNIEKHIANDYKKLKKIDEQIDILLKENKK